MAISTLRRACVNNPAALLQARIDRLALKCQHTEYTFMNSAQRFATHESVEALDAERELRSAMLALR